MSVPRSLTQSAIGLQASHPFTEYDGPYGKLLLFYTEYHLELLAVTELTVKIENSLKEAELVCAVFFDLGFDLLLYSCRRLASGSEYPRPFIVILHGSLSIAAVVKSALTVNMRCKSKDRKQPRTSF